MVIKKRNPIQYHLRTNALYRKRVQEGNKQSTQKRDERKLSKGE